MNAPAKDISGKLAGIPRDERRLVVQAAISKDLTASSGENQERVEGNPEGMGKPQPAKPRALPPLRTGDWITDNVQPLPKELIHGVLHQGCKMVLGGGSKTFKTWTLADLAISLHAGVPWWGLETTKGTVAYLNFEIPEPFFHERLRQIARAKGVKLGSNILIWNLRGHAQPAKFLLPELGNHLKGMDVAAIITDPIYKLGAGIDENSAKDVGELMQEFDNLVEQTGAASIFGAHFSKGNQAGKESMDRISGSGVFARDPDAILTMTKHSEERAFTIDATLRNCPPMRSFALRWEFPLMVLAPDLNPGDLKQIAGAGGKRTYTLDDIVNVLPLGRPHRAKQWQTLAGEECGVSKSRFYELKKEFEQHGHRKMTSRDGDFIRIS